jgi:hypothetical protein
LWFQRNCRDCRQPRPRIDAPGHPENRQGISIDLRLPRVGWVFYPPVSLLANGRSYDASPGRMAYDSAEESALALASRPRHIRDAGELGVLHLA